MTQMNRLSPPDFLEPIKSNLGKVVVASNISFKQGLQCCQNVLFKDFTETAAGPPFRKEFQLSSYYTKSRKILDKMSPGNLCSAGEKAKDVPTKQWRTWFLLPKGWPIK